MPSEIGTAGRKSEIRLGKRMGAKLRPNSGAVEGAKGDGVVGDVLWEAKSTTADTMRLEHAWLGKISREAREVGKRPMLTVSFTDQQGRAVPNGDWVMMKMSDYEELKEKAGEDRL